MITGSILPWPAVCIIISSMWFSLMRVLLQVACAHLSFEIILHAWGILFTWIFEKIIRYGRKIPFMHCYVFALCWICKSGSIEHWKGISDSEVFPNKDHCSLRMNVYNHFMDWFNGWWFYLFLAFIWILFACEGCSSFELHCLLPFQIHERLRKQWL